MRIVFMGSGELACPTLRALAEHAEDEVVAFVSQPDRPKGRKRRIAPCPAKALAAGLGLHTLTPEKVGDAAEELGRLSADLAIVADYGQYIPSTIVRLPRHDTINIHPSLLPKYRGAAPVQWTLANGETESGVTILYVSEEMDAGDIILQRTAAIEEEDTAVTLSARLAEIGARMVLEVLDLFRSGGVPRTPQRHEEATLAPKLKKEDGRLDWSLPAEVIRNRVRGFQPWPGCFCEVPQGSGRYHRILKVRVEEVRGKPGHVLEATGDGPLVAAGEAALRVLEIQPGGKKVMAGGAYVNGYRTQPGEVWG